MASIYKTIVRVTTKVIGIMKTIAVLRTGIEGVVMAKVIEFYIPKNFHKPMKCVSAKRRGKIIDFCKQTRKSA
jgi:hypothetical protein